MISTNRNQISLYQEAKTGLNSLVKQTVQVGAGFLVMLLVTGGKPPAYTVALSCVAGIAFVAWSEEKRLTTLRLANTTPPSQEQIQDQVKQIIEADTDNLFELVKSAGLNLAVDLAGANLLGVKGVGCNLKGFNLSGADLSEADLSRADLSDANLSNANLRSAKLNRASLICANLSNALLIDADFSHADLSNTNFCGADLINADLSSANLSRANLTNANLSSAKVENTQFGYNAGLSEDLKLDLEKRGAIFPQDQPATVQV